MILLQRQDFGRLLIGAGQSPRLVQFAPMQSSPFQHQSHGPAAHFPLHDFKRIYVHLNFFILVNGMKMRWCMIAVIHANYDSIKSAQFRHKKMGYPKNAACTAFIACSPFARSITTEILISLVEIMPMLMLSRASVSNIFAATPE